MVTHRWGNPAPVRGGARIRSCLRPFEERAALAQSVERLTRNEKVIGSIPIGGSTFVTASAIRRWPWQHVRGGPRHRRAAPARNVLRSWWMLGR